MKRSSLLLFSLVLFLMLFSSAAYSQTSVITSQDEIVSFTDPSGDTWLEPQINGSFILAWTPDLTGDEAGFSNLTVFVPFPNGGKFEITLKNVISSNANQLTGRWIITKNDGTPKTLRGTATNLSAPVGGIVTLTIGGYIAQIRITTTFIGVLAPDEVSGQILVNGTALAGATVRLREAASPVETLTTDNEGKYTFTNVDLADFRRVIHIFRNFNPNIVIEGTVFVGGVPLAGATVTVVQAGTGTVFATTTTDANGHYITVPILNATGNRNLRVLVVK